MEPVFQVPSRGTNLQQAFNSEATAAPVTGPAVEVDLGGVSWLNFNGEGPLLAMGLPAAMKFLMCMLSSCM